MKQIVDSSAYREIPQTEAWVPYEQRSAAWHIWNELYQVMVPYIQMLTIEELQEYGMPTSGVPSYDYGTANEMRQIMIPIAQMVVYYHRGTQVYVCNKEDTKRIYERISDHLNEWKLELTKSLNIGEAPLEDLKLMDQFANSVYEHAKYQFTDDTIASFLARRVDTRHADLNSMIDRLENPVTQEQRDKQEDDARYPKRQSMADYFVPYRPMRSTAKHNLTSGRSGLNDTSAISKPSMGELFAGGTPVYNKK